MDGHARPIKEESLVRCVLGQKIGLVGIVRMTRMVARAYYMADAICDARLPVVMKEPHVTEVSVRE